MKKVKIPLEEYTEMKNKLKFLEFYWSELTNQTKFAETYKYASDVSSFISLEVYDQINTLKVHSLTKRVTITERNLDLLKKFSYISDDLKKSV